jgi:hypothetical protein
MNCELYAYGQCEQQGAGAGAGVDSPCPFLLKPETNRKAQKARNPAAPWQARWMLVSGNRCLGLVGLGLGWRSITRASGR